jgi:NADPH:quinone reductase
MSSMRAVICRDYGTSQLTVETVPIPQPGADQILVRIRAASVNFADVLMIAGKYQVKPPLPFIAGSEIAGEIVAVGARVKDLRIGDRVLGSPPQAGAFAEYIAIADRHVWKIPEELDYEAAAGLLIAHGTAYFALQRRIAPIAGEWLLVTGAAGGVGLAAVEIGKRLNLRVIAAASSAGKLEVARAHGADAAVDYLGEDLRERVKEITGSGYNILFDNVGGDIFDTALRAAAPEARLLLVGFASGRIPNIAANYLLLKNLSAIGVGFGAKVVTDHAAVQSVIDSLGALHRRQPFNFEIGGVFALEAATQALEQLSERRAVGKLIVKP